MANEKLIADFMNKADEETKNTLYCILKSQYVKKDVISHLKNTDYIIMEEEIDKVVHAYVYDGKYDCNLSYWDNLDALIRKYAVGRDADLETFMAWVRDAISSIFPGMLDLKLTTTEKNNGVLYHTLVVKMKGSNIGTNIYMDQYFNRYKADSDSVSVISEIANIIKKNVTEETEEKKLITNNASNITDFNSVKNKIVMVLVNAEKNRKRLENVPHRMINDLAIIYKIIFAEDENRIISGEVKTPLLQAWGINEKKLHELALENTDRMFPPTIRTINEVIHDICERNSSLSMASLPPLPHEQQMYVVSNQNCVNGAINAFREDVLTDLANKIGPDLYIIPSSIHECIIISTDFGDPDEASEMVHFVNADSVQEEEQLSDHVYIFSKAGGIRTTK